MSFVELLWATGHEQLASEVQSHKVNEVLVEPVHKKLLDLLGEYTVVGGMPAVVKLWQETQEIKICMQEKKLLLMVIGKIFKNMRGTHN